uniref:Uncharacterized protein n=1 Tax=Anguilla anguilla TaxID=7936 RepID=A0A0E9U676_ANGAN
MNHSVRHLTEANLKIKQEPRLN